MKKIIKSYFRDNSKYVTLLYSKLKLFNHENKDLFKKISKFKNTHKNNTCYIIGTGPSVNKFDIKNLKNEFVIGLNFSFLHQDFKLLNKKYICLAPNHHPLNFDIWFNFFKKIKNISINQIFIGDAPYAYSISNFLKIDKKNSLNNLSLLNYYASPIINKKNINFSNLHDLSIGPLISPITTLVTSLQLAYYMGFTKINLIGIDHDILSSYELTQNGTANSHFYSDLQNHETKNNLLNKKNIFKWLYNAWIQYEILNDFYLKKGVKIINLNNESFLDVFDKFSEF